MSEARRKDGRLKPFVEGYRAYLVERGYTLWTVKHLLTLLGRLGRWMDQRDVAVAQLDREMIGRFLADHLRERGNLPSNSAWSLLEYLDGLGVLVPRPLPARSAVDRLVDEYRDWMTHERGLSGETVRGAAALARAFLAGKATSAGELSLSELTSADVSGFLLGETARVATSTVCTEVGQLRRFLRFLVMRGLTDSGLVNAVPSVANWREATIPKFPQQPATERLLAACDRSTPMGARDFAILLLLARLGLRAIEVSRLELDDIDWRAGTIEIDGKNHDRAELPLPTDVGEALVTHLHACRVQVARRVFLCDRAPYRPLRASGVRSVVHAACRRAGVQQISAHRLRHALASELLAGGASLVEIGQVLRHRHVDSTAIYTKVDLDGLRQAAGPWPGALR